MSIISGLDSSYSSLVSMLNTNSSAIDSTGNRLATGKRIASAQDDSVVFFQAQSYSRRAAELTALNTKSLSATRALGAAQTGLDAIAKQLQALSKTLADAKAQPADSLAARAVSTATFAGTQASLVGTGSSRFNDGDVFSIAVGSTTKTFKIVGSGGGSGDGGSTSPYTISTVQDLIDRVGTAFGGQASAGLSGGQLALTADSPMTIAAVTNGAGTAVNDVSAMFFGQSTGSATTATFQQTTSSVSALKQRDAAHQMYVSTLAQIDQLVGDAAVTDAGNLLAAQGDGSGAALSIQLSTSSEKPFTMAFNSGSTAAGLGLVASFASRFSSDGDIDSATAAVNQALDTVDLRKRAVASGQATVEQRMAFSKSLAESLDGAANDLTGANADEETVRLNALQATRQMAIKMIGARSQSTQMLLSLL